MAPLHRPHRFPSTHLLLASAAMFVLAAVPAPAQPASMRVVAGDGTAGFADGRGAEARFNKPIRLAPFGPDGVLVADIFNHAIRVVRLDGTVRTISGAPDRKGYEDGPASMARFASPHGVGVSTDGRIAVAEAENHTLRIMTPSATAPGGYVLTTLAGAAGQKGAQDGAAGSSRFNSPHAAVWGPDGALYTPDIGNATVRRVREGVTETVAGTPPEKLVYPMDLAFAPDGRLLIADAGSNEIRIWRAGHGLASLVPRSPLATPHGVAVGQGGTVYVADMKSHRVLAIDHDGGVTTVAGTAGVAGTDDRHLNRPAAVLVHAGHVWIADLDNHRICVVPLR